ncbi:MAG TPA: hypothetical protein VFE23_03145 [Usitatibacter sp.]|jgi:hypothetical protein|nr:hypothetical protein [Usitatibacter sp.]
MSSFRVLASAFALALVLPTLAPGARAQQPQLQEIAARAKAAAPANPLASINLTDVWHNPAEPGWGVFMDHQGDKLFGALFTYDAAGNPIWFVMSDGTRQPDGAYVGQLYRSNGPLADGLVNTEAVGVMRFEPGDGSSGVLTYVVGGVTQTKDVERFRFSTPLRDCRWSSDPQKATLERANFTSLWWSPARPGWGLALSQQGENTFGVLFVYDSKGRPSWVVMASGVEKSIGNFTGTLYRAARGAIQDVGSISLKFSSASDGVLKYRVDGADYEEKITRQTFSALRAQCSS